MEKTYWQKNFEVYLRAEQVINICGNIDDLYPSYNLDGYTELKEYINGVALANGFGKVLFYDSICGVSDKPSSAKPGKPGSITTFAEAISKELEKATEPELWVIENASYLCADTHHLSQEALNAYMLVRHAIKAGCENNRVIFLYEHNGDVPRPFVQSKSVLIPYPDAAMRSDFTSFLFNYMPDEDCEDISDTADGLRLVNMRAVFKDICRSESKPDKDLLKMALNQYITGFCDDPWQKISPLKINELEKNLNDRVRGQQEAISFVTSQVQSAASGVQTLINGEKSPRGLCLFSGTTGVGKTETAKALAKELFGDEGRLIRIDCSEYGEAHSCERLAGSPPGYVGYEQGGQLTNAVKQQPFSILLFDEIEKAHPQLWSRLMTMMEDGRMTSGQGETISFSNSYIIFTSNLGAKEASECTTSEAKKEAISDAIEDYFVSINRREIYGRLKHSIVVFNDIDSNTAKEIVETHINKIIKRYDDKGVSLRFEPRVLDMIISSIGKSTEYGGRDVKNTINDLIGKYLIEIHSSVPASGCSEILFNNSYLDENGELILEYTVSNAAPAARPVKKPLPVIPIAKPIGSTQTAAPTSPNPSAVVVTRRRKATIV